MTILYVASNKGITTLGPYFANLIQYLAEVGVREEKALNDYSKQCGYPKGQQANAKQP